MLESYIEKKCRDLIKSKGGMAIKLNPAGYRGIPDRLILLPGGKAMFVEFKRPGEKPRPNQLQFLRRLAGMGFDAKWFDSIERFEIEVSKYV